MYILNSLSELEDEDDDKYDNKILCNKFREKLINIEIS